MTTAKTNLPAWYRTAEKMRAAGETFHAIGDQLGVAPESARRACNACIKASAKATRPTVYFDAAEAIRLHRRGMGLTAIAALLRAPYGALDDVLRGARI